MRNLSQSQNYQNAQAFSRQEKLPVGAYLIKILDVKYIDNSAKGYNNQIVLCFDIEEGEHKGFYRENFNKQTSEDKKWKGTYRFYEPMDDGSERDGWTMNKFKTIMTNFEESNPGFHWAWDETALKGLVIGALFNEKEFDFNGRHGFFTNCHSLIPRSEIATAAVPEPTYLKKSSSGTGTSDDGFMSIPNSDAEEIPFA